MILLLALFYTKNFAPFHKGATVINRIFRIFQSFTLSNRWLSISTASFVDRDLPPPLCTFSTPVGSTISFSVCQMQCTTLASVRSHYDAVHAGVRFQCSLCPKSYTDRASWHKHRNRKNAAASRLEPVPLLASDLYLSDSETGPQPFGGGVATRFMITFLEANAEAKSTESPNMLFVVK